MIPWEPAWTEHMANTWKRIADEFVERVPYAQLSDLKALTPILWTRSESIQDQFKLDGVTENGVRFLCHQLLNTWAEMITVLQKATKEMVARGMPEPKSRAVRFRIARGCSPFDVNVEWIDCDGATVEEVTAFLDFNLTLADIQARIRNRRGAGASQPIAADTMSSPLEYSSVPKVGWTKKTPPPSRQRAPTAPPKVLEETADTITLDLPFVSTDDDFVTTPVPLEVLELEAPPIFESPDND